MALGPIQRNALGLAALLRLQLRGEMPRGLLEEVQPGIDLESWYLRAMLERWPTLPTRTFGSAQEFVYITWVAAPDVIQVPQGEWWYVDNYSLQFIVPSGVSMFAAHAAFDEPPYLPSGRVALVGDASAPFPPDGVNGSGVNVGVHVAARGFWLPPGATLGAYVDYLGTGTTMTLLDLRFARLALNTG